MDKANLETWLKEANHIWDRQEGFPKGLFIAMINNVVEAERKRIVAICNEMQNELHVESDQSVYSIAGLWKLEQVKDRINK